MRRSATLAVSRAVCTDRLFLHCFYLVSRALSMRTVAVPARFTAESLILSARRSTVVVPCCLAHAQIACLCSRFTVTQTLSVRRSAVPLLRVPRAQGVVHAQISDSCGVSGCMYRSPVSALFLPGVSGSEHAHSSCSCTFYCGVSDSERAQMHCCCSMLPCACADCLFVLSVYGDSDPERAQIRCSFATCTTCPGR
ncbi:hypothetical protein NDU88_011966 [Pleurodeles waltl]|uniref:Secreted protein n=1 Tax=Pleurodeles waltl TaxID=8319 RepID=A0AAV7S2S8_PLEWA|nr:hypothetical protein NDU88_011966 [Pleurodeles waltl]